MFERYTEKARRVIFFARYEASAFGSPYIESEYLLLGLLREDRALTNRLLRQPEAIGQIRRKIELSSPVSREKTSTSVDLPLSGESMRILAYAAEEAERATHKHIGTEHLLAGVLREERCFAAELLKEYGVTLEDVRRDLKSSQPDFGWTGAGGVASVIAGRAPQKQPVTEFMCGNKKLLAAISFAPPPRIGELVVLGKGESARRYRVRDVTYRYDIRSENAKEAAATLENVGANPLGSGFLLPDCITVYLEEEN